MILKNHLPFDSSWSPSRSFEDIQNTETSPEIPVVRPPDTSANAREPYLLDTENNPCPYWHAPEPKRCINFSKINYEQLAGRVLLVGMILFTFLVAIMLLAGILGKVFFIASNFK